MIEFDAGKLQVAAPIREPADYSKGASAQPPGSILKLFRFGLDELDHTRRAENSDAVTQTMPPMSRMPIFSHRMVRRGTLPFATDREKPLDLDKTQAEVQIIINYGDGQSGEVDAEKIPVESRPRTYGGPPTKPYVFGLADNADALVFRHAEGPVELFDFPDPGGASNEPVLVANVPKNASGKLI